MIEVIIDNKSKKIDPRLTIGRYQKIQINPERYNDPTEVLSLYLDVSVDELKNLPREQVMLVESVITENTKSSTKNDVVFTFVLDGITYGLENEWENMTWGQWTDLEVFSQKDKINESIHILMALLYRPVSSQDGTKYKLEKFSSSTVMERAQKFLDLPIQYWFGCATFFFLMSTEYIKDIQTSMKARMMIEKGLKPLRKILPKWLLPKVPQDSTLKYLLNSSTETLLDTND